MALADPIEMPSPLPVNSKEFDLNYVQSLSPAGALFIQTIERAEPAWIAKYSTPNLSEERDQIFQAFLDNLEGSMGSFLGFDPRRPRPLAYKSIPGEPWKDAGHAHVQGVSASYADSTINLKFLAAGAILSCGDYLSVKIDNAWYLFRIRQHAVVGGAGTATISVVPRPLVSLESAVADADFRFVRACCAMKILGKVDKSDSVQDIGPKYSFQAVQFRDRSTD